MSSSFEQLVVREHEKQYGVTDQVVVLYIDCKITNFSLHLFVYFFGNKKY